MAAILCRYGLVGASILTAGSECRLMQAEDNIECVCLILHLLSWNKTLAELQQQQVISARPLRKLLTLLRVDDDLAV